jgi:apolipoprotein N-acyltransferase
MRVPFLTQKSWMLWAAAALSAALLELPFPLAGPMPPWRSIFAWFGLVPLLWALLSHLCVGAKKPLRTAFLVGYLSGVLWYIGNCYWVRDTMARYGDMPPMAPTLLLIGYSAVLGLYWGVFGWAVVLIRRASGSTRIALAAAPVLWAALELVGARFTSVPWDQLGYSQVDNGLVNRLAPWTGVYGISLLLVAVNALIAGGMLLDCRRIRRFSDRQMAGVAGVVLMCCGALGATFAPELPAPTAKAMLIQPNLDVSGTGYWAGPGEWDEHMAEFAQLAGEECKGYIAGIPQTGAPPGQTLCPPHAKWPDLVVWPESPAPYFEEDRRFRTSMATVARAEKAPVIVSGIGSQAGENGEAVDHVSAMVFGADGEEVGRYDKIHLVPFGEYIPFSKLLFFAHKLTGRVSKFTPGDVRKVFRLSSANGSAHRYGVFICYEAVFADEVRRFAQLGAEVLVNISDDGWYGDTSAPWQHLNMARMRAIENRRWILRATNNGVTCVIDPYGVVRQSIPRHVVDALPAEFGFRDDITFYTEHGDVFGWGCVLLSAVLGAWAAKKALRQLVGLWKNRTGLKDSASFVRNLRDDDRQKRLRAD